MGAPFAGGEVVGPAIGDLQEKVRGSRGDRCSEQARKQGGGERGKGCRTKGRKRSDGGEVQEKARKQERRGWRDSEQHGEGGVGL